jgi:25S rRNA (uracil2634-N3)-methyltransferase
MPLSKLQQALLAQQSQSAYVAARKKSGTHKQQKEESLKHSQKEKKVLKKVRQARRPVEEEGEKQVEGDGMVVIDDSNRPSIDLEQEKPKKKSKKTKQGTNPNQLPVVPFTSTDTILLLGEANFSYTLSLIAPPHSIPTHQMLATSYDTERECYLKYPDGEANVTKLREAGVKVEFKVDAGNLEKCKAVGKGRWSRVIFNFPHAGMSPFQPVCHPLEYRLTIQGQE